MADELTQDEEACLLIVAEGTFLAPIGRWEQPVKSLTAKGLMYRGDAVNYGITDAGRERAAQLDREQLGGLVEKSNQVGAAQAYLRAFIEPAAQLLAQAAQVAAKTVGDSEEMAVERCAQVALDRAKQLLAMQPTALPRS